MSTKTKAAPKKATKAKKAAEEKTPVVEEIDEYAIIRENAIAPFRRTGKAPKPDAGGRAFDSEDALEDFDPLFDEVGEEQD
ncbi:MAG: hypothetical protein ACYTDT_12720 [Planctomycetota bacterium]